MSEHREQEDTFSCQACKRPDAADNVVQCDVCDTWWHFSCAGVTEEVQDHDWKCVKCENGRKAVSTSSKSTSASRRAILELNLRRIEVEREIELKRLALDVEATYARKKFDILQKSLEEEDRASVRSRLSQKRVDEQTQQWVENLAEVEEGAVGGATIEVENQPAALPVQTSQNSTQQSQGCFPLQTGKNPSTLSADANHQPPEGSFFPLLQEQSSVPSKLPANLNPHLVIQTPFPTQPVQTVVPPAGPSIPFQQSEANVPSKFPVVQRAPTLQGTLIEVHQGVGPIQDTGPPLSNSSRNAGTKEQKGLDRQLENLQMIDVASLKDVGLLQEKLEEYKFLLEAAKEKIRRQQELVVPPASKMYTGTIPKTNPKPNRDTGPPAQSSYIAHLQQRNFERVEEQRCSVTDDTFSECTEKSGQRTETLRQVWPSEIPVSSRGQNQQPHPSTAPDWYEQGPTPRQLAARQVLPRDLPTFTGNPADWPVFISNYTYTTEACGYSEGENMIRLQRCLKGSAWESVRSRLILPASVPHVIEALRMRYGRTDLLIESLAEKVKSAPTPKVDRLETLIEFGMMVQGLCDHIIAADLLDHLANPTLLKDLVSKLPAEYRMRWAAHRRNSDVVNLKTFSDFMEQIVTDACSVTSYMGNEKSGMREKNRYDRNLVHDDTANLTSPERQEETQEASEPQRRMECFICKQEGHRARECRTFKELSVDERWRKIQSQSLCRTCLYGHGKRSCRSTNRCGIEGCQARHHPLLHSAPKVQLNSPARVEHHVHQREFPHLLFRIIPVTLYNGNKTIDTYAFLDEGSSLTMVESSLATELGINGVFKPLCLKWTGNVTREVKNSKRVALEISGLGKSKRFKMTDVATIDSLDLPLQSLPIAELKQNYQHLEGLPIKGYQDASPQLLIGIDNLKLAFPFKGREGQDGDPIAVKTRLGWCVYGGRRGVEVPSLCYHICDCGGDKELDEAVKTYFALEEAGVKSTMELMSQEDIRATRILEQTTKRVGERYQTGLLWKYDKFEFPDSYPMAYRRLQCLERRMSKNPNLRENIEGQIREYQEKGYAHRATSEEMASADPRRTWYLPLGAVTNPKKPEKVRLIWDAAAKVDGISLNSLLLKGPDQLASLSTVLFRFRQHRIAVCADIKQMFHQVCIQEEDRHAQRFLWRSDSSQPPVVFVMDVATFGATCSPSTAQYVKNSNAKRFENEFPRAVEGIVLNHYVDDYLDSFPDEEEAKVVSAQVKSIHGQGGFELRNWCSNSSEVLEHLGESKEKPVKNLNPEKTGQPERVLGMLWDTESDEFHFSTNMRSDMAELIENNSKPTKRQILRCVMALFDPLGLLAPYLVFGKILIQDVWRSGIDWDEQIDDNLFHQWQEWTNILNHIPDVRIPRSYFHCAEPQTLGRIEMHTFVDASEVAYSSVTYFRITNADGRVEVVLVAAKTKVAPLKPVSIPRLELQGCVLGVRLAKFVEEGHSFKIVKRYWWTDSTVSFCWINADPLKYRPYVKFRVGEIRESSRPEEWRWVPSKQNPADEATKWGSGPYFKRDSKWFGGPEFLRLSEDQWPQWKPAGVAIDELRPCHLHREVSIPETIIDANRFSWWNRIHHAMAYVHRFLDNVRKPTKADRTIGHLTQDELQKSAESLIKMVQGKSFPDEFATLTLNSHRPQESWRPLDKSSTIFTLTPLLDEKGILRVGGRIGASKDVTEDTKYPIILPKKNRLTFLILDSLHRELKHANNETVVNEARQRFWIPQLRSQVKEMANSCHLCKIRKAHPRIPQMAPLPPARLSSYVRPFSYVGLDYFGPLLVKIGRSHVKRWVAIFTCLTIRAVHVEVAFNLTTESCILCVRRFVCRRGSPLEFHSDNGTNFHGADRVLREQINQGLAATFTSTNTVWRFIPPGAPHMGGAWERMVRSVKTALTSAHNSDRLNDEGLQTLLVEAEAIVNSRPLTYLPLDSEEQEALTPNHFLLGNSSGVRQPVVEAIDETEFLKHSWKMIQKQLNTFWKRWVLEYLPTLTKRTKWFSEAKPVQLGDLVIVIDETRRNGWTRGRVLELIVAKDGRVRQAMVQTSDKRIHRRPVSRLAVLDVTGGTEDYNKFHRGEDVATEASKLTTLRSKIKTRANEEKRQKERKNEKPYRSDVTRFS